MQTYLQLKQHNKEVLPEQFEQDDVRYADELVRHFLLEFSSEDSVVFDPFAGFGTTLIVAESMDRQAYGIEYDSERCKYVQSLLKNPKNLICGDARRLSDYQFPQFDLSITSPPFMNKFEHPENPFTSYSTKGNGYAAYLKDLQEIYRQMTALMKPTSKALLEVANLKVSGGVTPLAWDIAQVLSEVLSFDGEIVICWDKYGFGYDHSYCLVFSLPC